MSIKTNWYIIRAIANSEKKVSDKILNESKNGTLIGKVNNIIIPTENVSYFKNGKKLRKDKILYPGYIFINTNYISEVKEFIKNIKGVSGFLASKSGEIQCMNEKEVKNILKIEENKNKVRDLSEEYIIGESIIIIDGPFENFKAKIDSIYKSTVTVSVSIFDKKTPLVLNLDQIKPLNE